jgi:hypothetical protein
VSASNGSDDAAAPGAPSGDDNSEQGGGGGGSIGWRRHAEGRPELAMLATCARTILASARAFCCRSLQRKERGRRGFYRRACLVMRG